jgi:hypothetical protein
MSIKNIVNVLLKKYIDIYHITFFIVVAVALFMVLGAVTGRQRNFRTLTTAESGNFDFYTNQYN